VQFETGAATWCCGIWRRIRPLNHTQTMAAARSARERSPSKAMKSRAIWRTTPSRIFPSLCGRGRIDSSLPDDLPNAAFQEANKATVLVVANTASSPQTFSVAYRGKSFSATLQRGRRGNVCMVSAVKFSKRRKESLECTSKQDFTTSVFLVRSRAAKPMRLKGFRLG
jgi:hypothetical protein